MKRDIVRADELVLGDWTALYGQVWYHRKDGPTVFVIFRDTPTGLTFKKTDLIALV